MSALDDLTATSTTKSTTMPAWFDNAQQTAVNKAISGVNNMPAIGNTVAGNAIDRLSGPNNPFDQAQSTLNTIATGAANPWLTDASGNVTPNTNTALGGLFSAQNQQLKTLLPQYEAPATAGAITGGNFGSLRGQTAADTAVTNAQADLFAKQMQAALTNQQTGVNAATGLSNSGEQSTATESKLGQIQQSDPMTQAAALTSLLKNISAPTTETATTHASPLAATAAIGNVYGSLPTSVTGPINDTVRSILDSVFGSADTSGVLDSIFGNNSGAATGGVSGGLPSLGGGDSGAATGGDSWYSGLEF